MLWNRCCRWSGQVRTSPINCGGDGALGRTHDGRGGSAISWWLLQRGEALPCRWLLSVECRPELILLSRSFFWRAAIKISYGFSRCLRRGNRSGSGRLVDASFNVLHVLHKLTTALRRDRASTQSLLEIVDVSSKDRQLLRVLDDRSRI
jgi:hypothetical protein